MKEEETNKSSFTPKNIGTAIIVICALIGAIWVINQWYDSLPQLIWQVQGVSAGVNSTPNSCTIQAYASICPFTLTNNQSASIFLQNTGAEPAYFYINFTRSNLKNLVYYTNSSFVKAGATTYFPFIPTFSPNSTSFSIKATATCKADALISWCKGTIVSSRTCNYQISGNSQVARLIPTPTN